MRANEVHGLKGEVPDGNILRRLKFDSTFAYHRRNKPGNRFRPI